MNMFSPYAWLAIILSLSALFGGTYWKGRVDGGAHVQAQWDNDKDVRKLAEQAAVATRLRENEAKAAADAANKAKLKKGYESEITQIRADAARDADQRLRIPTTVCAGFAASGEAGRASGSHADAAGTVALPTSIEANLRALMVDADEIVAGCRVAQDFIKSQGMAP